MKEHYDSFVENVQLWHLCTPGELSGVLFGNYTDYVYGMNLVGLVAAIFRSRIRLYAFQIMSNHFHFVLSGEREDVFLFFRELYIRMKKFLTLKERFSDLKGFSPSLFPINDIVYLRNVIAYVNRNGYLVDRNATPFSYKWGANRYFFSPLKEYEYLLKKPLSSISINGKRKIFHTHFNDFPDSYYLIENFISPLCYVNVDDAEKFFTSAHHYYSLVSRQVEMFSSISNQIGDKIVYTDEELSSALYSICKNRFGCKPFDIDKNTKLELAKELHFKYNASNQQIRRVMRLDIDIVNALFSTFSSR